MADRHLHLLWPGPYLGDVEDGAGRRGDPNALTLDDLPSVQGPGARMKAHAGEGREVTSLARHCQVHGVGDDVGQVVQRERIVARGQIDQSTRLPMPVRSLGAELRIERLADPGSFAEIGALTGFADYDAGGRLVSVLPANFVAGTARVVTANTFLNFAFLALAAGLLTRFLRTNGLEMMRMMNSSAESGAHTHRVDGADARTRAGDSVAEHDHQR